jgi:hypothetical protein
VGAESGPVSFSDKIAARYDGLDASGCKLGLDRVLDQPMMSSILSVKSSVALRTR